MNPVAIAFRLEADLGGHYSVGVFIGRNIGARGKSGTIVVRHDEWDEIEKEKLVEILPALSFERKT